MDKTIAYACLKKIYRGKIEHNQDPLMLFQKMNLSSMFDSDH